MKVNARPTKVSNKKLCHDLDIKSEVDFSVLVAFATYLKPDLLTNVIFIN